MRKDIEHKLILTVGLPYSGKSTWARSSCYPMVCPDNIRHALHGQRFEPKAEPMVWAIAKIMVRALFGAGHHSVILDACSHTANRRDDWQFPGEWRRFYLVCDIHKDACIERARDKGDEYIIPVIERMAEDMDFDNIMYGEGLEEGDKQFMRTHVEDPDGQQMAQIYHEGIAGEDV